MKPSERIKQMAIDIRNTDMLGRRLPTSHTPKINDYVDAIVQFLDEGPSQGSVLAFRDEVANMIWGMPYTALKPDDQFTIKRIEERAIFWLEAKK